MKRFVLVALVAAVLAVAPKAEAALVLSLSDGTNTVTITDGGAGDISAVAGAVGFSGAIGGWIVNVSTGLGSPLLGPASLDLNSINVLVRDLASPLTIMLTQTFNTIPYPGWTMEFGGTIQFGTVTYSAYADPTNTAFGLAQLIGTLGPFGTGAFSGSTGGSATVANPYSLTQVFYIIGDSTSTDLLTFSGNAELNPVPEPGTLMLLGAGLVGLAGLARRRARKV